MAVKLPVNFSQSEYFTMSVNCTLEISPPHGRIRGIFSKDVFCKPFLFFFFFFWREIIKKMIQSGLKEKETTLDEIQNNRVDQNTLWSILNSLWISDTTESIGFSTKIVSSRWASVRGLASVWGTRDDEWVREDKNDSNRCKFAGETLPSFQISVKYFPNV